MWKWNSEARRYYNDDTGLFMAKDTVLGFVHDSFEGTGLVTDTLANLLGENRLAPADWRFLMREEIKREYIRQYLLGIGGREQMTQADWGRIGGMLTDQYRYLDDFYKENAAGALSEAQVAARSRMYIRSAREAYERANAQAWGGPPLPAYPGDGSTVCLTNCACHWDIRSAEAEENVMRWSAWWVLGAAEHCPDCIERSTNWAPLVVEQKAQS
jgi:hypothetical protein